jgi:hypothetical protein
MNSSSRTKLLAAALGLAFVGSVVFLVVEGQRQQAVEEQAKETLGKPAASKNKGPADDHPHCPECGRELPNGGECPFCLMKKREKAGGKEDSTPVPRLGRYLAWTLVGFTVILGAVHLGIYWRALRRATGPAAQEQFKTRCPYCKRRVRFTARLSGTYGSCPTCKQRIQFTPMPYD